MKKFFTAAVLTVSAFSLFGNPYAGYLYPAGVKAGSTVRVLIGGQNFNNISGGVITGKGVRVKRVVSVPLSRCRMVRSARGYTSGWKVSKRAIWKNPNTLIWKK